MTIRIAMWSGPRNISTAMMRAWDARSDCAVMDEPFYGAYLAETGLNHPMRAEILAAHPVDFAEISKDCATRAGTAVVYQKHMCQHMIDGVPRAFMADCVNVFLIRHPARVVASFAKGYPDLTSDDIGFDVQAELYDHVCSFGLNPIVIDSADIRQDPAGMLQKLCEAIGLEFSPAMLSWQSGPKPYDGPWAPHWYKSLHATTGFAGPEGPLPTLSSDHCKLVEQTMPAYQKLEAVKIAR